MSLSTTTFLTLRSVSRFPSRSSVPRASKRLFLFTRARQSSYYSTRPSRLVHCICLQRDLRISPSGHLSAPFSTASYTPLRGAAISKPMAAETDAQAAAVANQTGVTPESIEATLKEKLQAELVVVEDVSGGCGQSFEAAIVSPVFSGKGTLARHRLVNGALKEEIKAIHAWTPRCFTGEEWEKRKGGG